MPEFEVCGLQLQEFCGATKVKKQVILIIVNISLSCYHYIIVHQLTINNCLPGYPSNVIQVTNSTCRTLLVPSQFIPQFNDVFISFSLREKCPNTEFFLVRIWPFFTQCLDHCNIIF